MRALLSQGYNARIRGLREELRACRSRPELPQSLLRVWHRAYGSIDILPAGAGLDQPPELDEQIVCTKLEPRHVPPCIIGIIRGGSFITDMTRPAGASINFKVALFLLFSTGPSGRNEVAIEGAREQIVIVPAFDQLSRVGIVL